MAPPKHLHLHVQPRHATSLPDDVLQGINAWWAVGKGVPLRLVQLMSIVRHLFSFVRRCSCWAFVLTEQNSSVSHGSAEQQLHYLM
jgi:hypothetical protein